MSKLVRAHAYWLLPVIVVGVVLVAALTAFAVKARQGAGDAQPSTQEIVLVSRDVAFWVDDRPQERNPRLTLQKGRPVRLVVRNEEREKVLHCFTITGLDVATTRNLATGESETLTFTPTQSGTFAYACLMHPMMTGTVVVR
jgi:heme/copper-type cytochrome/quinol oxidase subunit 2